TLPGRWTRPALATCRQRGPRPAARESWAPSRIRRRQVACRKRGQVRALQGGCGFAALGEMRARRVGVWRRFTFRPRLNAPVPKPSDIELGDGTRIAILHEDRSVLA